MKKKKKHCGEKEKLFGTSNFSFFHSVFRRIILQTRKNKVLFGKGLIQRSRVRLLSHDAVYNDPESRSGQNTLLEVGENDPFTTAFSTVLETVVEINIIQVMLMLSSANSFNLDKFIFFPCGKELMTSQKERQLYQPI